jgi:RNA polymerase sigma-70 factor (ECF subfamily)
VTAATRASLRRLLRDTSADLLAYFERRVHVREDAADLLSETLLQSWRRSDALPEEADRQRMWLFTIAANVLANHNRSSRRRAALAGRLRAHMAGSSTEPDPTAAYAVRDAVLRLADAQRELIMLIHWDGFSVVEAAELLGLNPSTARGRYSAARATLRGALTDTAISP